MAKLRLTLACGPYDRMQALRDGSIRPDGIKLNYLTMQPAEIFWRMLLYKEFDVSEMSLSNYAILVSRGDAPFVAIPVYPSRVFRHAYFFINTTKGIKSPHDLAGKRAGVPEYSVTAAVYMRGVLQHEYGITPDQVSWVQSRPDRLDHPLPPGVHVTPTPPGVELTDMLERGEIDFLLTANNPLSFRRGAPTVARLFPNFREVEQDYYRRTQIYPIMHVIAIRREVYDRDPWIAQSLYQAFCAAKERSYRLLLESGSPKISVAWLQALIDEEKAVFGPDWYPYGIEKNRPSLQALVQYLHEQGLSQRRLEIEELFAPSTLRDIPVGEGQFL
jgi:4,5-dihydroxyphthalate decarboxylase